MRNWFVALIASLIVVSTGPAQAEKKVALVIGNDRYTNLPILQKAVNDAAAVGDTLARLGFEVIRGRDLGRQGMIDKLSEFSARIEAGDTALFFFAGHGVAIGGVNYLVPSDVPAATAGAESRVRGASIAEGDIIAEIQAKGARVAVLVLDACRDNPFPRTAGRSIGNTRGLADARPARGVFTFYSAGIGQTALDRLEPNDKNPNSVFTRVFVEQLARPGLHIGDLAIEVREKVAEIALQAKNNRGDADPHEQTPAYYDQTIGGRVFLAGRAITVEPAKPAVSQPAPVAPVDPDAAVRRDYEFAERQNSKEVWEEFLRKHPTGIHATAARQRLAQLVRPVAPVVPVPPRDTTPVVVAPPVVPIAPPITTSPVVVAPPVVPVPPPITTPKPAVGVFGANPLSAAQERALKPKDSFKECETCPEMVVVPAGSFTMGSPANEEGRLDWEGPQHGVNFARPFAVGRFALTIDQFAAFVQETGREGGSECTTYEGGELEKRSARSWRNPGFSQSGSHPAACLNWRDAKSYVAWLSRKTGKTYRLLTEAEHEYVTRAGTTTPFWWGSSISTSQANYDRSETVPVNSFQPNPWGLYQVHGNVWERVEDCWNDSYSGAPTDGSAWTSGDCGRRVLRGGAWGLTPGSLRAADRGGWGVNAVMRLSYAGFRVARTLSQ